MTSLAHIGQIVKKKTETNILIYTVLFSFLEASFSIHETEAYKPLLPSFTGQQQCKEWSNDRNNSATKNINNIQNQEQGIIDRNTKLRH